MSEYKRPSVTADAVIFSIIENELNVLLIQRKNPPYQDSWAIPGGFVDYEEDLKPAAARELEEETGVKGIEIEQIHTFGRPGRDPRGRNITVVYYALVDRDKAKPVAGDDAKEAEWFSTKKLPNLAFDHNKIISFAVDYLRVKLENTPVVKNLMPEKFTFLQLQEVYEIILDKSLDSGRFKVEILKNDFVEKVENSLYKFKEDVNFTSKFY